MCARILGKKTTQLLSFSQTNATVIEIYPQACTVRLDQNGKALACHYRRSALFFQKKPFFEKTPLTLGDRVLVDTEKKQVLGRSARKNLFFRHHVFQKQTIQPLGANLDLLVLVHSSTLPPFQSEQVDRIWTFTQHYQIPCLLLINKIDLYTPTDSKPWSLYQTLGLPVKEISVKTEQGISELKASWHQKTVLLCGPSGTGKTSLLSRLLQKNIGPIQSLSIKTNQGRHTTSRGRLFEASTNPLSLWGDLPGIQTFPLKGMDPKKLNHYFPEFQNLRCHAQRYGGCFHIQEKNCLAKTLPRYRIYRKLWTELSQSLKYF